ncbi:hypothetical protein [Priestia megaterium]|nr:hypothetical protein [Priestia megaterium]MBE2976554.1 hypothetical protein [Priestia megaterium]
MLVFLAVDWRQGEDSCVKSEAGETHRSVCDEEAQRSPAESEVLHGNQNR